MKLNIFSKKLKNKILIISGATASGKNKYFEHFHKKQNTLILCMDSKQIFKKIIIGTNGLLNKAKENKHKGFHSLNPQEKNNRHRFFFVINFILNKFYLKNKLVILIGGCGLYLKNFRYISSKILKKNENIIKHFFLKKKQNKLQNIYKKFIEINSNIKKKISQNDTIRIIQNLEKYYLRKEKLNNLKQLTNLIKSIKNTNWISFWPNRYSLKKKIKNRAKKMFLFGILKEGAILKKELPETCFLLSTMGYKEALMYIKGVISKKNAIKKTTIRHNQYAKKQFIWFKKEKWWKKIWPFEK